MVKRQQYKYIITLDSALWPRKIADELMNCTGLAKHLVSVADLQNTTHIYGDTYTVRSSDDNVPQKGSFVTRLVACVRSAT